MNGPCVSFLSQLYCCQVEMTGTSLDSSSYLNTAFPGPYRNPSNPRFAQKPVKIHSFFHERINNEMLVRVATPYIQSISQSTCYTMGCMSSTRWRCLVYPTPSYYLSSTSMVTVADWSTHTKVTMCRVITTGAAVPNWNN